MSEQKALERLSRLGLREAKKRPPVLDESVQTVRSVEWGPFFSDTDEAVCVLETDQTGTYVAADDLSSEAVSLRPGDQLRYFTDGCVVFEIRDMKGSTLYRR